MANPYLSFALVIYAGLDGVENALRPDLPMNVNLYKADADLIRKLEKLPRHMDEAASCARGSELVQKYVPEAVLRAYCERAGV